ncbi:MAG: DUF4382 domain-containing protein [Gammaproteobacteria bacterium]|nr:DUF4382 domain-containing protein [Gammaproteobacteria bacterium]
MNTSIRNLILGGFAFAAAVSIASCGGGGGGGSASTPTGSMSLSVTDAAIDTLPETARVMITFTGVELQPQDGERVEFTFDNPKTIDLLALTGNLSEPLLGDHDSDERVTVPAGSYNWIRLAVNAQQGQLDSFVDPDGIDDSGDEVSLYIPSGDQSGLKLFAASNKVFVAENGEADFVIDFDLRNSVFLAETPGGDYRLRPTIRIVNRLEAGSIAGTATTEFVDAEKARHPESAVCAVYVFAGPESPVDDIDEGADGTDAADGPEPLSSASLEEVLDDSDPPVVTGYTFEVGFLDAGTYTLAVTCQANLENAEGLTDDDETVLFSAPIDVEVTAGDPTPAEFTL